MEAVPIKKRKEASLTSAEIGRNYCNQIFKIEDSLKNLSPDERFYKRLKLEKPVLETFWCGLGNLTFLKGSALGKAVIYAKNQNHIWRTIFLIEDLPFQTMQQKMPSVHLLSEERTGCLLILQKETLHQLQYIVLLKLLRQMVSTFTLILNICSCICQT